MHLIRLEAENVKRLKWVEVVPKPGEPVVVRGKNKAGKSSLLDAIRYLFGGARTHPPRVIREGENEAHVEAETEDFVALRRWTKNADGAETTELELVAKDGGRMKSPQAILDKLYNDLTFSPLDFLRQKPQQQVETLKKLTGVDTTALEAQRENVFGERTLVNRDLVAAEARLKALPGTPPPPKVDVTQLLGEQDALNTRQAIAAKAVVARDGALRLASDWRKRLEDAEAQIAAAKVALADAERKAAQADNNADDAIDAAEGSTLRLQQIREQLGAAQTTATAHARWDERQRLVDEVRRLAASAKAQTEAIAAYDAKKESMVAAAKFPVPGLGFGLGGVTLGGLPFEQASQAEQVRVSVAMATALNPRLRVMLVREGSFLDEDSQRLLADLCRENDMQCWLEMVGEIGPASVVIVDGERRS